MSVSLHNDRLLLQQGDGPGPKADIIQLDIYQAQELRDMLIVLLRPELDREPA